MRFQEYRERKIPNSERQSCAEVLAAMDCLMHHMNEEDEISCWLQEGVPDNGFWPVLETEEIMGDRKEFYYNLTGNMTYGDYEACVKIFACAVKEQCFRTSYQPRSFT